jgi:hypothetical protein
MEMRHSNTRLSVYRMGDASAFMIKGDTPAFVMGDGMGDALAFMMGNGMEDAPTFVMGDGMGDAPAFVIKGDTP